MKIKWFFLIIVILFCLFVSILNFGMFADEESLDDFVDVDRLGGVSSIVESNDSVVLPVSIDESPNYEGTVLEASPSHEGSQTLSVQEDSIWMEGESIKVDISYPKKRLGINEFYLEASDPSWDVVSILFHAGQLNDGILWKIIGTGSDLPSNCYVNLFVNLFVRSSGTFSYEMKAASGTESGTMVDATFSVNSSYIDSDGKILARFTAREYDLGNELNMYGYILNYDTSSFVTLFSQTDSWDHATVSQLEIRVDEISYDADDTHEYCRSEYRVASPSSIGHRVSVENSAWGTEVTIYNSSDWEFAYVSPETTVVTGENLVLTNTMEITYDIYFTSTSNQYLAIEDVSDKYLLDIGFEGSWQNDWTEYSTYTFDSITLNSTIVSEGAFSLRMDDATQAQIKMDYTQIPYGEYYISFDIYIEEFSGTQIDFSYYDGSWQGILIDTSILDRWQSYYCFIHPTSQSSNRVIRLQLYADGIFFFDNFRIFQVNHEIDTFDYSKTKLSGVMNSWTSRGLISVSNHNVTMQIRDRTVDTLVKEKWVYTDINGYFYWDWEGSLEQKEYEFRSWSWDNYFGDYYYAQGDAIDFNEGDLENFLGYQIGGYDTHVAVNESEGVLYVVETLTTVQVPYSSQFVHPSGQLMQYARMRATSDVSWRWIIYDSLWSNPSDATDYHGTSWVITEIDVSDYSGTGSNYMRIESFTANTSSQIDWIKLVDKSFFSPSYFTPLPTGYTDYAIQEQEDNPNDYDSYWGFDGWDFQEGTDGWDISAGDEVGASNGYYEATRSGSALGPSFRFIGLDSVDQSYYTGIVFRIWVNRSMSVIYIKTNDGHDTNIGSLSGNTWGIFEYDFPASFNGDSHFLICQLNETEGNTLAKLDYCRFIHKDSDLEPGYSWEFNEDDYYEGMTSYQGTHTINNGIWTCYGTGVEAYIGLQDNDISVDTSVFTKAIIKLRHNVVGTTQRIAFKIHDTYFDDTDFGIVDEWKIYEVDFTSGSGNTEFLALVYSEPAIATFEYFQIDWIRFIGDPPNLHETETAFILENEESLRYETYSNNINFGSYITGDVIPKNFSAGANSFAYSAYEKIERSGIYLPSAWYKYDYIGSYSFIPDNIVYDPSWKSRVTQGETVKITHDAGYSEFIRSGYEYSIIDIKIHYIEWQQIYSGQGLTIYLPTHWSNVSIYPYCLAALSDSDLSVSGLFAGITYTLLAYSGSGFGIDYLRQNQYLAIEDVSGIYLDNIGFEGEWRDDFYKHATAFPDSVELNSTIVSQGVFSIRVEDTDGSNDYLQCDFPAKGSWYLSFDYYQESLTDGYIGVEFAEPDSRVVVLETETNRWHKFFGYFRSLHASYDWWRFRGYLWQGVVFIDNVKIWQVNHQVETIDYSKTRFSGTMISWDGYANPVVPYHNVNMQIRDRTANAIVKEKSVYSDANGYFFWDFEGSLEQKEYEFRSWSYDSWFGVPEQDEYSSFWDSSNWDIDNDASTDVAIDSHEITLDSTDAGGTSNSLIFTDTSIGMTLIDVDYFTSFVKVNVSFSFTSFYLLKGGSFNDRSRHDFSAFTFETSYTRFSFDVQDPTETAGTWDYTDVDDFFYNIGDLTTRTYYCKEPHFIQAQKSYFTPLTTGYTDYAMKMQEDNPNDYSSYWGFDGWDFQEEVDNADYNWKDAGTVTVTCEDGYMNISHDVTAESSNTGFTSGISIDSYYNTFIIRVTAFSGTRFGTYWNDGSWRISSWYYSTGIFVYVNTFTATISTFCIHLEGASAYLTVDYLRAVHCDFNLESGRSLEFNEDALTETEVDAIYSLEDAGSPTRSVDNGKLIVEFADSSGQGSHLISNISISSDFASVWIKGDSISGRYPSVRFGTISTGYISHTLMVSSNNKFEDVVDIPDSCYYLTIWVGNDGSGAGVFTLDFVRFISEDSPPNLYETDSYFVLENEQFIAYESYSDDIFIGNYFNGENIPKNQSVGSHTFDYVGYSNNERLGVYLPSAFYRYSYSVTETDICSIIIVDQSNRFLDPRGFKIYQDSNRIYGDTFYWSDTSATKNITITDIFDNQLYQDLTTDYSRFNDVVLTLYSLKIQNLQPDPIWISLKRGSKTFSEWVFSFEVIHYRLESDTYNLTIYYSSFTGNIGFTSINGTTATYSWSVSSDNAIVISGNTIQDVFGNIQDLLGDLSSVNSTIHSQILNINISLSNQNVDIENQVINVDINLDNINSTISTELVNIDTAIANLDTNINLQITDINTTILNINGTLWSQTNSILSNITNVNSTIYTQTLSILSDISNVNTTIYDQTVTLLSNLGNVNTTIYLQTLDILTAVSTVDSTVDTIYSQTVDILIDLSNTNSTIYAQTVDIISKMENTNSTLYTQNLEIISDIYNTNVTLYAQMIDVITSVYNYNSSVINQVLDVYAAIINIEPADPVIEVDLQEIIDELEKRINELEKKLKRDVNRETSFWGSVTTFSILVAIGISLLALFREKDYRKLKKFIQENVGELFEYFEE